MVLNIESPTEKSVLGEMMMVGAAERWRMCKKIKKKKKIFHPPVGQGEQGHPLSHSQLPAGWHPGPTAGKIWEKSLEFTSCLNIMNDEFQI